MVGGDGNNRTGWRDARYDALIAGAAHEADPARRFAMLREAEAIVLDQAPVIPIYQYSTNEMVKPYVRGMYPTALDTHPLKDVWIDHDWARAPGTAAIRTASAISAKFNGLIETIIASSVSDGDAVAMRADRAVCMPAARAPRQTPSRGFRGCYTITRTVTSAIARYGSRALYNDAS